MMEKELCEKGMGGGAMSDFKEPLFKWVQAGESLWFEKPENKGFIPREGKYFAPTEVVRAEDYRTLEAQLAQVTQERDQAMKRRDDLELRIQAVDAEHADMERQKHRSIEAFLALEKELAQARQDIDESMRRTAEWQRKYLEQGRTLREAQQRAARLRDALDRIIHVADGKPAYQAFANEAKNALTPSPLSTSPTRSDITDTGCQMEEGKS